MFGKIFLTGVGMITTIGRNIAEVLYSLKSARSGVGFVTQLDTIHNSFIIPAHFGKKTVAPADRLLYIH